MTSRQESESNNGDFLHFLAAGLGHGADVAGGAEPRRDSAEEELGHEQNPRLHMRQSLF